MKIKKITAVQLEKEIELVDISVEEDQTFWVSDESCGDYILTHNSLPDIDCLPGKTLVKIFGGKRPLSEIKVGDFIVGVDGTPKRVLFTKTRELLKEEELVKIFFEKNGGFILATENHRFPDFSGKEFKAKDMKQNMALLPIPDVLNSFPVVSTVEKVNEESIIEVIDITVEDSYFIIYSSEGKEIVSHNSDCADREEAIKILIEHFGEECVLPVSNYNQLQLKSLIKDLARLYQIPFEEINPITQKIEKETLDEDKKQDGFDRGVWFLSYESAVKNSPTFNKLLEDYPQLEASIKVLFKQIKSCFTNDTLLLTNNGWKKYSEITEQDKIAFVDNVGEIQYSSDFFKVENGEKEIYKIETLDGKVLELTEDHLVQTDKGWKQVKDLTNEDSLIGWI